MLEIPGWFLCHIRWTAEILLILSKTGLIVSLGLASTTMTMAAFSSVAVVGHSCAKLSVPMDGAKVVAVATGTVFIKTTWLPSSFSLAMTDGADAEVHLRGE